MKQEAKAEKWVKSCKISGTSSGILWKKLREAKQKCGLGKKIYVLKSTTFWMNCKRINLEGVNIRAE